MLGQDCRNWPKTDIQDRSREVRTLKVGPERTLQLDQTEGTPWREKKF